MDSFQELNSHRQGLVISVLSFVSVKNFETRLAYLTFCLELISNSGLRTRFGYLHEKGIGNKNFGFPRFLLIL